MNGSFFTGAAQKPPDDKRPLSGYSIQAKLMAAPEEFQTDGSCNNWVVGSDPFTSGFLSIDHSSGIPFLLDGGPRSEPIAITGPSSGLYNLTPGRRSGGCTISRVRWAGAQENEAKLKIGV